MLWIFNANSIYCKELKEQKMQYSTSLELITLQCNIKQDHAHTISRK